MTILQHYRRRARQIGIPCLVVACLLVLSCFFVGGWTKVLIGWCSCGVMFGALIATRRITCPRCGRPMGRVSSTPATRRMIGKPIRCRNCGVNVEEPVAI
jgi:DNA-directed RNA polymerase subunit RPC12/RpoP